MRKARQTRSLVAAWFDFLAPAGISVADLGLAVVDEIEKPQHLRARFTVATA